jgi:hypothetical protein
LFILGLKVGQIVFQSLFLRQQIADWWAANDWRILYCLSSFDFSRCLLFSFFLWSFQINISSGMICSYCHK